MEEWKDVPGYEGLYTISSMGRLKRLRRSVKMRGGWLRVFQPHLIKLSCNKRGYIRVHLSVESLKFKVSVHRLVALAFVPNPENKPHINHLNGKKDDNRAINLEWSTAAENNLHAHQTGLTPKQRSPRPFMAGLKNKNARRIQFLHTGIIMSVGEGAAYLDLDRSYFIDMMKGRYNNWTGFIYL